MLYIGHRPTINGVTRNIEVNLFDFGEEIYGDSLTIHFQSYIRGDMKFDGLDELRQQMDRDKEESLRKLENIV